MTIRDHSNYSVFLINLIDMKIRTALILVLALLIVIFTLQNTEVVSVKLWFWEVRTSRALLIIASLVIGSFFGMLIPPLKRKSKDEDESMEVKKKDEKLTGQA